MISEIKIHEADGWEFLAKSLINDGAGEEPCPIPARIVAELIREWRRRHTWWNEGYEAGLEARQRNNISHETYVKQT